MSGITYHSKTKKKACEKLISHICTFMFEEKERELKGAPPIVLKRLDLALRGLAEIINKN